MLDGPWTSRVRWQGLNHGVVKMLPYNDKLPGEAVDMLNAAEAAIKDGSLDPYRDELRDQHGNLRVAGGSRLYDPDIGDSSGSSEAWSATLRSVLGLLHARV